MIILVTGAAGLLGTALAKVAAQEGRHDFVFQMSRDLTQWEKALLTVETHKPDVIIHAAAKVGGVRFNAERQEEMFYENAAMSANVIHAAVACGVKEVIAFGSTCAFDEGLDKLDEGVTQFGKPFFNNFAYAYAKRMTEVHLHAAREQHSLRHAYLVPVSMFGPGDNFDLENAHVIPSLVHKCFLAKERGGPLVAWGDGSPRREVLFSEDMARVVLASLGRDVGTVLVSGGEEVSVRSMAEAVAEAMDFRGDVVWDSGRGRGQSCRPRVDAGKFREVYKDFTFTPFKEGIRKTVDWFVENYPNVRR